MSNEVVCSNCGTSSPSTAAFCGNCGQPLTAPAPAAAEATQPQPKLAVKEAIGPPELADFVKGVIKEGLRPGVLIGAGSAGALLFLASHSLITAFTTAFITFVVLGTLRACDEYLLPLWRQILKIPPIGRIAAATLIPIVLSRTLFQPSASGKEVSRARMALIVSMIIAYCFMRPRKTDLEQPE